MAEVSLRAIADRWACLAVCALALGSCGQAGQRAAPCQSRDLLALATEHYRAHVPPEILKLGGGKLSYFFEDEGDVWHVMVAPSGDWQMLKLNKQMSIRKSDRQVRFIG